MAEFGIAKTIELVPDGSNIAVTRENRLQYIQLVSHYRLSRQIRLQSRAFFEGLSDMIDANWLRMFNQHEVQILLGGTNSPIDVDDLKKYTNYGGTYDENHAVIVCFWKVVKSFDQEQRRALLRFVTSCSRPPLLCVSLSRGSTELNTPVEDSKNWYRILRYDMQDLMKNVYRRQAHVSIYSRFDCM